MRWFLIILVGAGVVGLLVTLLWPGNDRGASLWFWCCAAVFPLMAGLMAYALRRQAAEGRVDYVDGWNEARDGQLQALIEQGQRHLLLITAACCTAAGNNKLAQALRSGVAPLQPRYLESQASTLRLSQLQPASTNLSAEEYAERLGGYLRQVVVGLGDEWRTCAPHITRLRIRHDGLLGNEQVLALWHAAAGEQQVVGQVNFATRAEDGLLWLDSWLDAPKLDELVLSLEINGYLAPQEDYAESVSAVLLAGPDCSIRQKLSPLATVHRPVRVGSPAEALEDALRWGHLLESQEEYFYWQSQVADSRATDSTLVMSRAGISSSPEKSLNLDGVLGRTGCAVGNLALVVAGEQAASDGEAQLILLEDTSLQWCVVRPV
jgi:hypothetical protein